VVRFFLIIQVSDARDKGSVAVRLRPIDCFALRLEGAEDMIGMIFDYIVVDIAALRAAFGTRFDINVRHALFS